MRAVMSARLKEFIMKECRFTFARVYFLIDSEIVLAMLQKDSYMFHSFVGSRVGEIQSTTDLSNWYWTNSEANIGDWITRPRSPGDIHENSTRQKGPKFMEKKVEDWPIKQECVILDIPERIKVVMSTVALGEKSTSLIDVKRFSNFKKLIRTTARVLAVYKYTPQPSLRNIGQIVLAKDYDEAVSWWIYDCQKDLSQEYMNSEFVKLCPRKRTDGIWVVGSRSRKWVEITYNHEEPIFLPYHKAFTKLYVEFVHAISHSGVAATMAKVRLRYWVVNLRRMVKSIVYSCVPCKLYRKGTMDQIMGELPLERTKPSPPWYAISVDLFGPYEVKGSVNKRIRKKVYGVLFSCLVTRAVYIDVASDYSTNAFLMVLRRLVSLRGYPRHIFSDNGS